jgi:hypothetical protein
MKTGIILGIIVSTFLIAGCYLLLGAGADMCNPGYGFLLSPLILLSATIGSVLLINNKSALIANAARIVVFATIAAISVYIFLFFL